MDREEIVKRLTRGDARTRSILATLDPRDAEILAGFVFAEDQEEATVDAAAAPDDSPLPAIAGAPDSDPSPHERQAVGSRRRLHGTEFSLDVSRPFPRPSSLRVTFGLAVHGGFSSDHQQRLW